MTLLIVSVTASAYHGYSNGIYYNLKGYGDATEAVVTCRYNPNDGHEYPWDNDGAYSGNVEIPSTITYWGDGKTYPVTAIDAEAFICCSGLTSVVIPSSITSIGGSAFYECTGLMSITIGRNARSFADNAFSGCHKLKEIYNLSSLNLVEGSSDYGKVAYYAKAIHNSLDVPSIYYNVEDFIYYDDAESPKLINYMRNSTDIIFPKDCNGNNYAIDDYAFYYNTNITAVTIPKSVVKIGDYAFWQTSNLTSVTSLATTPPEVDSPYSFYKYGTLHVLPGSGDAYRSEYYWKDFTIVEDAVDSHTSNTENLLVNGNFEADAPITQNIYTFSKNMPDEGAGNGGESLFGQQAVSGWTAMCLSDNVKIQGDGPLDSHACGVFAYVEGTESSFGYEHMTPPAASIMPQNSNGKALGILASWAQASQYTQDVTLPAGYYLLSANIYNVRGKEDILKNLNGFFANTGKEYTSPISFFPEDTWLCDKIVFALDEETSGKISLGYIPRDVPANSLKSPRLYYDEVSLVQISKDEYDELMVTCAPKEISYNVVLAHEDGTIQIDRFDDGKIPDNKYKGNTEIVSAEIGNGLTVIGQHAFEACSNLQSICLPANIRDIQASAFAGCDNLNSINCMSVTPPAQYGIPESSATLHVLKGLKEVYENSVGWAGLTVIDDIEHSFQLRPADNVEIPVATGQYFIKNTANGKFMGAGGKYSTQASNVKHADIWTLNRHFNGVYTLYGQVAYEQWDGLGLDWLWGIYCDIVPQTWIFNQAIGGYTLQTIYNNETYYLKSEGDIYELTTIADNAVVFEFVPISECIEAIADADADNPVDATFLIKDANFGRRNRYKSSWIRKGYDTDETTSNKNLGGGNDNNFCAESWSSKNGFNIYQTISVPNGVYVLNAQATVRGVEPGEEGYPVVYANDQVSAFVQMGDNESSMTDASNSFSAGMYNVEPITVVVVDGTLTVGVKSPLTDIWALWDNFELTHILGVNALDSKNAIALAAQKALIDGTNIYDHTGYDAYVAQYEAYAASFAAGTLKEVVVNPNDATGHRASTAYNFLLTPWSIGGEACNNFDKALYINTWSTEGEKDGSNFLVPFFEYFASNSNSLGANTIATTVTGLDAGQKYEVSILARVRIKDNASGAPQGISMTVGNGEAVNLCGGSKVGSTQFYLARFTAEGNADDSGNLKISINVASGNSISWLSFKDVTYTMVENEILKGDANGDGVIDVVDVTYVINHILEDTPEDFDEVAADVNSDEVIDIVDITTIINMILADESNLALPARQLTNTNAVEPILFGTDFNISAGETAEVAISLADADADVANMQMDINIPEGLTLTGVRMAGSGDHNVIKSMMTDGRTRIIALSMSNSQMADGKMVLSLKANEEAKSGSCNVEVNNIVLSTSRAQKVSHADFLINGTMSETTDIKTMTSDNEAVTIYNVAGQQIESTQKGINIFRSRDKAKKVIVK